MLTWYILPEIHIKMKMVHKMLLLNEKKTSFVEHLLINIKKVLNEYSNLVLSLFFIPYGCANVLLNCTLFCNFYCFMGVECQLLFLVYVLQYVFEC